MIQRTLESTPKNATHWSTRAMVPGVPQRITHDYVRAGTTTLFASLEVAAGKVLGSPQRRHRAEEFKKFLIKLEKEMPAGPDVHLVLDNFFKLIARADRTPLKYNGSDPDFADRAVTGADIRASMRSMFFYDPYQAARDVVSLRKARATRPDPQPSDGPADPFDAGVNALHWAVMCADNSASGLHLQHHSLRLLAARRRTGHACQQHGGRAHIAEPVGFPDTGGEPPGHAPCPAESDGQHGISATRVRR